MTQPQQHYDVTDDDFDFIWKNIDSPLVVRDRINVIKTRSHPYQSERDKVLDELVDTIKEDFTEGFDGDLTITYGDFLFNVNSLRKAGEP